MSSPRLLMAMWFLQTIVQIVIAAVLYRRKLHREYPAFFTYIAAQLVIFCVQFPVFKYGTGAIYFDVYWVSAALNIILAFRIIHEIFLDVFKPYHALKDLGTALFKWAAIIMVLLSVALIMVSPSWEDPVRTSILIVQRCVRVVQCGLVIFLLAFSTTLAVNWRRFSFGIALGFGIFSACELLTTALFSGGRIRSPLVQLTAMATYLAAMLVWLGYCLVNRRREMVPVLVPQRWDEALMDIHTPEAAQSDADSLIPMFEHMVDQALSKTNNGHA